MTLFYGCERFPFFVLNYSLLSQTCYQAMESETDTPSSAQLGIVPQGPSSSVEGSSRLQSGYPTPVESLRPFFQTPTLRTYSVSSLNYENL